MDVNTSAPAGADAAEPARSIEQSPAPEAIGDLMHLVTIRQQEFEQLLSRRLAVDAAGLSVMDLLMRAGPATPTELARQTDISTAAMTLVLDRLESAGHVTRERHPSDRRKVVVTAAAASTAAADATVAPLIAGVHAVTGEMTPAERATVHDFLTRVVAVYDTVLHDTP